MVLHIPDVNECSTNNGGCDTNAECTNTAGGRNCQCKTGYNGDGFTCSGKLVVGFKLNINYLYFNIYLKIHIDQLTGT